MRKFILILAMAIFLSVPVMAMAWGPNTSPYNPRNSPYHPENSPYHPRNSPYHPENSPFKPDNPNLLRDTQGNPRGYVVPRSDGGRNYFDMQGNRRGYQPGY